MISIALFLVSVFSFGESNKVKTVYMNNFNVNDSVIFEVGCGKKTSDILKVSNKQGKSCSVPANAKLKVVSKRIEPIAGAASVGEENGFLLKQGREFYTVEYKADKITCQFEVNDAGDGFAKFHAHQGGKKLDACIVSEKNSAAGDGENLPQ